MRPQPAANAPKVFVETYGCQMNVADSDLIGSVLADAGYAQATRADEADVIVVNTCAVREKAEERVIARASELGPRGCGRQRSSRATTSPFRSIRLMRSGGAAAIPRACADTASRARSPSPAKT